MCSADGRPVRVLCAGIAVYDHIYSLERFPPPGTKTRARQFVAIGGGCAANAAVALRRLGGIAAVAAPLGGPAGVDGVGDQILAGLARERIDCSACVRVEGATSPISAILVDGRGERLIVNHRDDALSNARVADPAGLAAAFDAILADNRFASFVLPLCRAGLARGVPVVLDGDRPTRASDELLTACSHLVFAADGLRATAQCDDLGQALRRIAECSPAFVAVTDGANGVYWLEGASVRHMPAFTVESVDTLAAGDVFHGAFVLALAQGSDETAALRFACAAAALKCRQFGGIAGAPRRPEVDAFLRAAAADASN